MSCSALHFKEDRQVEGDVYKRGTCVLSELRVWSSEGRRENSEIVHGRHTCALTTGSI